ncbi:MAG TPA: dockerin type I domain-containing protein [Candidatus Saccharimonadales bacterium]|nr:dockerin type I domain-containing protein [Candidatus Saccharimonadales bacterium]
MYGERPSFSRYDEEHRKVRRLGIQHGLVFAAIVVAVASALLLFSQSHVTSTNDSFHPEALRVQEVRRAITDRMSRDICGVPLPGHAHCLAQESINNNGTPLISKPSQVSGYGPAQFHTAYNLPCAPGGSVQSICSTPGSFGPQTIAIVDAGGFEGGVSNLYTSVDDYSQNYGIPNCDATNGCLDVVNQTGGASLPAALPQNNYGWTIEMALDVETAHTICQTCKIVLVQSNDDQSTNLATANSEAATFSPVSISNSWSGGDDSSLDSHFEFSNIAEVAATGDTASEGASGAQAWPADNPDVVAVSGTTLAVNVDNTWASETVWGDSGGGCSSYSAPAWQTSYSGWSTNGCGSNRAFGDVSADADPNTGAAVNVDGSWYLVGGTSLATPIIAGIYALTGGVASNTVASSVPYTYFNGSNSHDITSGNDCQSGQTQHCTATTGFDVPSGLGSPNGLGGFTSLPTQPVVTTTTVDTTHVNLTWTASTASAGIKGYNVYRNGTEIAVDQTATNFSDSGLVVNTSYQYQVVAIDNANNLSLAGTATGFPAYPADINLDGHINLLDLSILASEYGEAGPSLGRADINKDGVVNLLDLSILAGAYGSE